MEMKVVQLACEHFCVLGITAERGLHYTSLKSTIPTGLIRTITADTKVHILVQSSNPKRRITKEEVKIQNAIIDVKEEMESELQHLNASTPKQDIVLLHSGCTKCSLHQQQCNSTVG